MKKQKERQPLSSVDVDIATGLTDTQIAERKQKGYINSVKIGSSKSYFSIFVGNIFTFFNLICFLVFIWLITVIEDFNGVKNLTFMVIIVANIIIGIAQEIRAKFTMDKLSLLSSPDVKAFRNGSEVSIKLNEILLGEIIKLKAGAQVCSDSVIREGEVEVNEALLTGESQAIKKGVGDILLSGSFIVSGSCVAEVDHIAEDNYIQKLAMDAKQYKKADSELLHSLKVIFKIISICLTANGKVSTKRRQLSPAASFVLIIFADNGLRHLTFGFAPVHRLFLQPGVGLRLAQLAVDGQLAFGPAYQTLILQLLAQTAVFHHQLPLPKVDNPQQSQSLLQSRPIKRLWQNQHSLRLQLRLQAQCLRFQQQKHAGLALAHRQHSQIRPVFIQQRRVDNHRVKILGQQKAAGLRAAGSGENLRPRPRHGL